MQKSDNVETIGNGKQVIHVRVLTDLIPHILGGRLREDNLHLRGDSVRADEVGERWPDSNSLSSHPATWTRPRQAAVPLPTHPTLRQDGVPWRDVPSACRGGTR